MTGGLWLGVYAHVATLLLPVVCCAGVGAVWDVRKLTYPAEFIAMLATVVCTPALVFHTVMTTRLDNAQLLEVGSATLLGLALAAVLSGLALRSLNMLARTLGPAATFPNTGNLGLPIAQLAFGDAGLAVAVAFFAVNSLVQHTLGVWVMSRGGNRSQPQPWPKGVMFACLLAVVLRATVDRPACRRAGDPPYQSASASGRRDDTAIRHAGRCSGPALMATWRPARCWCRRQRSWCCVRCTSGWRTQADSDSRLAFADRSICMN